MYRSKNENELLDALGVTVYGVEGVSDAVARKLVGGVLSKVVIAAESGGEASKKFLEAVRDAHDTKIFVTKDTCVAYHEGLTNSVKINPGVYANYRRYPERDFKGKIEDFEGILIHEISHGLPELDFLPVKDGDKGAKWNAPEWKENAPPMESARFAKSVAVGHGVAGVVRLLGGTEQFRDEAREELRAVRVANAVMSEVSKDYKPRLYYVDPGMGGAKCDAPEGKRVDMQEGGLVTDAVIRAKHLGEHLLDHLGELIEGNGPVKQHSEEPAPEQFPPRSEAGENKVGDDGKGNVSFNNFPGSVAANHVLEVIANDPERPQKANDTIRARIAENKAKAIANGEVYVVDRVEKVGVTLPTQESLDITQNL